eukprot:EG_transcript_35313
MAAYTMEVICRAANQKLIKSCEHKIHYSNKYDDTHNEYRHVVLPKELAKLIPKGALLSETEWRGLGVQQSPGWEHYMVHRPEPHILLFRRPKNLDPKVAQQNVDAAMAELQMYMRQATLSERAH